MSETKPMSENKNVEITTVFDANIVLVVKGQQINDKERFVRNLEDILDKTLKFYYVCDHVEIKPDNIKFFEREVKKHA